MPKPQFHIVPPLEPVSVKQRHLGIMIVRRSAGFERALMRQPAAGDRTDGPSGRTSGPRIFRNPQRPPAVFRGDNRDGKPDAAPASHNDLIGSRRHRASSLA